MAFTSIEICAGAGGQAIGLQRAGFRHVKLVEYDDYAVKTLILNEPSWKGKVIHKDLRDVKPQDLVRPGVRVDLLAGGIPCPPFSVAGKQLGKHDVVALNCLLDTYRKKRNITYAKFVKHIKDFQFYV